MDIYVDYETITKLFDQAQSENRNFLFEYEVYEVMRNAGSETPPHCLLMSKGTRIEEKKLAEIPGEKVVIKVVSPHITRKSDVGGVSIVSKKTDKVEVKGYVTRSDGKNVAWINNSNTLEKSRVDNVRVHRSSIGKNRKVGVTVNDKHVSLKPGEKWTEGAGISDKGK